MNTGWQREFIAASRQANTQWNETCLREDIRDRKLDGKTPFELACEYGLSERKVRKILTSIETEEVGK